ncbi:MAG: DUF1501 domain-containing protein [Verrucomicrobia bacterium]|nr:DUF1501 domain-containing protein [Verrucomicrobiota bacterium]
MNPFQQFCDLQNRRQFLTHSGMGLGAVALANAVSAQADGTTLHHTPRAKRVVFLFMAGGPSQLDLFDYKPDLHQQHGKPLPKSVTKGQRVTAMTKGHAQITYSSPFKFSPHGESGLYLSELLPHLSAMADDLCLIKSTNTDAINHDPAQTFFCTGSETPGKASMGAWLSYGLGSMNRELPDFVVLQSAFWSAPNANVQALYSRLWGSGFLPSRHQGVAFQPTGDPVLFLSNPPGVDRGARRQALDLVTQLNRQHEALAGDPEIETSIGQQEMAFRMQTSVPELTDLSKEDKKVMESYGPDVHKSGSFARNCLLARRMVERNVRFIQLFHRGWDHHSNLPVNLRAQVRDVDQPITALLRDLKQRSLLDDTLVVFAGEFGRTTYGQAARDHANFGRDHHPRCFTTWMAGGGIKGGISYGETDEFSYNVTKDPVHVRDFHATIMHQLGINHERLTVRFQGLDQKLTGVKPARVVKEILA